MHVETELSNQQNNVMMEILSMGMVAVAPVSEKWDSHALEILQFVFQIA